MTILVVDGLAKIYRKHGNLWLKDEEGNTLEVPLPDLELVVIIGERISITSSALLMLANQNIPVVVISGKSGVSATFFDPVQIGSMDIRRAQYKCIEDSEYRLYIVKQIVKSKLKGLYNLVKYEIKYHKELVKDIDPSYQKACILAAIEELEQAGSIDEAREAEAKGSKAAWALLTKLFPEAYGFSGRKPRRGDVVNTAIDFTYAVLYGVITKALVANGLDPYAGFMHTPRQGRTSLTYDFSELYKPLAVHAVLKASRTSRLRQYRESHRLTPKTIEQLVKHLHRSLRALSEKTYKRKSIWIHPMREAYKLQKALREKAPYNPYTYNPPI